MGAGDFGEILRRRRLALGLTQEGLATRAEMSVRAIGDLECGRTTRPFRRSVRQLAAALGLEGTAANEFASYALARPAIAGGDAACPPAAERGLPGPARPGRRRRTGAVVNGQRPASARARARRSAVLASRTDPPVRAHLAGRIVPRQLPAAVAHFVGRDGELATLNAALDGAGQGTPATLVITAIGGMAGVGKTALAVHWAQQRAGRFPDGQLYIDLRGFDPSCAPMRAATAVRRFLDALQVPAGRIPADLGAQIGLYRSVLADKRVLIVLDNARDPEQVRPLLPGTAGCMVLITSRSRQTDLIALDGAIPLTVDLLTTREARELLVRRLGPARITSQQAAADELIGLCARLPLAVNIAASRAMAHPRAPLSSLAAELRDTRRRLDLLSAGTGAANLRAVFSWSCQAISSPAARMFRLLGVHPGPDISIAAAASLAATGPDQARRALDELTAAHLLTEHAHGRYRLHDLLRAYAAEQAQAASHRDDGHAAACRVLDHYLYTARAATLLVYPARDLSAPPAPAPGAVPEHLASDRHALAWFDGERQVLLAATALAANARFDTHAWQIPSVLAGYLERGGHWHDYAATQTAALGAAERAGDLAGQANARLLLGRACSRTGSHQQAQRHLRHALELYTALGDHAGQAHAHHSLGWTLGQQRRYREALQQARQALSLYRTAGHRTGQARALNTVGWYGSLLGMHQQALTYCQQALELHHELGNHDGEADAWDSLGHAHHHLRHSSDAIACYRRALRLFQKLGDRHQQADTLARLGDTYRAARQPHHARDAWQQALDILTDLHHPSVADIRTRLASLKTPLTAPDHS
jgi:tetratricopeptide (TPR) repeat protein/transcriptional regulator with XRE-family HTH domain